ncbi:MAG: HigA family addiction module antidote protein [Rhodocyclaceae bacterium]|nr:HigA family addiction module antidote protein [Rhodocyclaceae bacterium]
MRAPVSVSPPASDAAVSVVPSVGRRSGAAPHPGPRPFPSARRRPPHPGRFLDEHYLGPLRITQDSLARALGVSRRRVNEIVRGRRGLTPDTAIRLAHVFGGDPAFWLNLQAAWDLHMAMQQQKAREPQD